MIPFAAASLGIGLASAGYSWWLGQQQADQQRAETRESVRRFHLQNQATLGQTTARGAASGFAFESEGLQKYLGDMDTEFKRQEDWMLKSGLAQADATASAANFAFLGGAAGSFNQYGAANNWWQKPATAAKGSKP